MVRAVGLEPTRIAPAVFKTAAFAISPRPRSRKMVPEMALLRGSTAEHAHRFCREIDRCFRGTPHVPRVDPVFQKAGAERVARTGWVNGRQRFDIERKNAAALSDGDAVTSAGNDRNLVLLVQGSNSGQMILGSRQSFAIFEASKDNIRPGKCTARSLDADILNESR